MKSEKMREDELNRAVVEDQKELGFLYANYHNYTPAAADSLDKMSAKHKTRQLAANEQVRRQVVKDELGIMGVAGCLTPIVCVVLGFGFWFSSAYPSWESVKVLFGW
jgi:hypothetical protein